jgi:lysophospholipase L1-like esterase
MRQLAQNLSLSILAVLLCFAVGEIALRVLHFDRQLEFELDDDLYWRLRPHQSGFVWMGNGTFRSPEAHINEFGLRGNDDDVDGHAERFRILMLGDSYTFGSGVADDQTFSAVLQRALGPRVDVLNGGVPGYGVFQDARALRRLGPLLRPQLVVVTIPTGDVVRQPFATPEQEQAYLRTERKRKRLREASQLLTYMYRQYSLVAARWHGAAGVLPNQMATTNPQDFTALWKEDYARLGAMADQCRKLGAMLVVMLWTQDRYGAANQMLADDLRALAAGNSNVVSLVDLNRELAPLAHSTLAIPGDGHPSARAHAVAGRYLAEAIRSLLPGAGTADKAGSAPPSATAVGNLRAQPSF